ncbi:MAG: 4-hydroxy-3-methylbut-2-enyl diphosphate reductase [Candidatus Omnitrophota bacterium]
MKIHLARSAGFCFGVKRALHIALKTAASHKKIFMLGDIVHNEEVVRQITEIGIKKIHRLSHGKERVLLIRAHGASREIIKKALCAGYKIIDATCPMVKEIHKIARNMENKGHTILIIGDKNHDEVRGILGQLKRRSIIIENQQDIPIEKIRKLRKVCVVVQSTQNLDKVLEIITILKSCLKGLKFFNTICQPTRVKQQEIKRMPFKNNVMIIIGSRTSANTRRLFEISKSLNPRTYWVTSKREIRQGWFRKAKSVGITAGASTPEATTRDIVRYIKQLT